MYIHIYLWYSKRCHHVTVSISRRHTIEVHIESTQDHVPTRQLLMVWKHKGLQPLRALKRMSTKPDTCMSALFKLSIHVSVYIYIYIYKLGLPVPPGTVAWRLAPGAWCLVSGIWCLAHGTWCLMPGAWCLVPGACSSSSLSVLRRIWNSSRCC